MDQLPIHIEVHPDLYLKNPDASDLGRSIVSSSIELIYELGFESFTIKKLSTKIGSPESSIYRYFESKHMILFYLIFWYWSWIEYRMVFAINNLSTSKAKLIKAIEVLSQPVEEDSSFSHINEIYLDRIIMTEAVKAYFSVCRNKSSSKNYYIVYQRVVERISKLIMDINPKFKYPKMLITTMIEGSHQQRFFAQSLPELTDIRTESNYITKFYTELVLNDIKK